jgi:hypothetical protein
MSKKKFILTDNLIKVEKEPVQYFKNSETNIINNEIRRERISLNINGELKTKIHMHCINSKKTMTELIEELFVEYIKKNSL